MDGNKSHSHTARAQDTDLGTKTTSSFDYGTKSTNTTGNHTHQFGGYINSYWGDSNHTSFQPGGGAWTQAAGDHAHTVYIGGHEHTMYIGPHGHVVIVDADGNAETTVKKYCILLHSESGIMTFKMSDTPQTIKIFNLRSDTNEFIGAGDAYIPPHTGLPANCTDIAPPDIPSSYIAVFDSETQTWSLHEDRRGETVYDTTTGNQVYISDLGPLPENVTSVSPGGGYKKWDSKAQVWVNDEAAEAAARLREAEGTKNRLLQIASEKIAPLQDVVDLDEATDKEKASLLAWRKYRVQVNRVDTLKPVWPEKPASSL